MQKRSAIQLQYKNFFLVLQLYCTCADPCNTSFLQLAENLQATCSNLYCSCIALVRTAAIQQKVVLFYCSCIALVHTT